MENNTFKAREERRNQLLTKPISELIEMIIYLEGQVALTREYRSKLMKIKNILTPEDERRGKGRPRKEELDTI